MTLSANTAGQAANCRHEDAYQYYDRTWDVCQVDSKEVLNQRVQSHAVELFHDASRGHCVSASQKQTVPSAFCLEDGCTTYLQLIGYD